MNALDALRLPIDFTQFGWSRTPEIGGVALAQGDPAWAWTPQAPALAIHTFERPPADVVEDFVVDHVVILVPDLEGAIDAMGRIDATPRLRMNVGGRPAAFFRAGPVLEVIEAPVRAASIYGIALATSESLEALALRWRALGLDVGTVKPAIQEGRRIMTVHGLEAGFAVMSDDRATV